MEKIKNLSDLIAKNLSKDEQIVKYETSRLTALGENYGSLMLSLKITVKSDTNESERVLETIAKLLPRNEVTQEMFNVQKTFKNEIGFYEIIVPTLENLLKECGLEHNINFLPKYFGGRISLNSLNGKVDNDATLILENLKIQGFAIGNRLTGFDFDTAKVILRTLAQFHTIPLALKIKHPKIFEDQIKPHLSDFIFIDRFGDWVDNQIRQGLQDHPECSKYLELALETARKKSDKTVDEKWATILHNDFWVNNIMIKREPAKNIQVKLVDFQVCEYKSCLRDVIFFLFSSCSLEVLEKHLDDLLGSYYVDFIQNLTKLGVDTRSQYSRKQFDEQLRKDAKISTYFQIQQMLYVILLEGKPIDPSEMTYEILENFRPEISQKHKDRIVYTTKEFVKRGWL